MFDPTTLLQAFRYGVFGIATNTAGYLLYLFVTELGVDPKLAVSLFAPIAVAISYFGNKQWTFKHSGRYLSSFGKYIIIHIFSYLINISMLLYFVDTLGFPHQLIQGIAIFVCAGFLFLGLKFIFFHKN